MPKDIFDDMPRLSDKAVREIEQSFDNDREAHVLLDLIVAEFNSDPTSVQCFDLRIVERAKACVAMRKKLAAANPMLA